MSKEEKFTLAIANLETERLSNSLEVYDVRAYLNEDFHFDINANNASTKVYNVVQLLWSEGLLEVFVSNNILTHKLEVKDLVAFDSARFSKLILEVLELQLLSEEEAWGLLFLNAQRVQDSFQDLEAFKTSYLKGALFFEILFKSDEENRGDKIENFDVLFQTLYESSKVAFSWLKEDVFSSLEIFKIGNDGFSLASSGLKSPIPNANKVDVMHRLLAEEDKTELWSFIDALTQKERNEFLSQLYVATEEITAEDYLELPALYPNVSYAHYLRAVYFYHYAWEARGLGITNTVGQKNYALFYERLRYARTDLKKAYELSSNEQTYWAELYNLVKHFKNKESDHLEDDLYERIKENGMENTYCIERVAHMKKARWGGSHEESLAWAREVITHSSYGDSLKIIIFEVLIEQYEYIIEYDRDEAKANAIFKDEVLKDEVNQYFDELVNDAKLSETLLFWYEKVEDEQRLKKLRDNLI